MCGISIIFEDEFILVVDKPAGIGTQAPRQFDSLEARVRNYLNKSMDDAQSPYLGIPHRIDRCVSGTIVFAKRKKSAQRLAKQFERREVGKTYLAVVTGRIDSPDGTWHDTMRKIPEEPKAEIVAEDHKDAKHAILHYRVLTTNGDSTRLSIKLETGRMHQIRLQCSSRGHSIWGDTMYGSDVDFGQKFIHARERQIALHAETLSFQHPRTREPVSFSTPPPAEWSI